MNKDDPQTSEYVCRCGLPQSVFEALEKAGSEIVGRAVRMCPTLYGTCRIRKAVLQSLFS